MLDLQRFQQYVAEEQGKYVEDHTPPLMNGRGTDHVPPHSGIAPGQTTDPSTGSTKISEDQVGSTLKHGGRGPDHVAPHSSMGVGTDHSQSPSFLSQESANTVIAGAPNFVKPGTGKPHNYCLTIQLY